MRKFFILFAAIAAFSMLFSCNENGPDGPVPDPGEDRVVIIYFSAANSLSRYAEDNYMSMREGTYLPALGGNEHLLVFFHNRDVAPVLIEMSRDPEGNVVEKEICSFKDMQVSASAESVEKVLTYVKERYVSESYGLILWSHSTGWLPEHYYTEGAPSGYDNPADAPAEPSSHVDVYGDAIVKMAVPEVSPASFGQDEETEQEIDIRELSSAIPMHLDFLIFDSCLMGCVEVAYQFRDVADIFCASPTEILANGFPYSHIVEPLFWSDLNAGVKEVADLYFYYYSESGSPYATISVVDCSRLESLASACKAIYDDNRDKVGGLDMGSIQPFFRLNKHWFYDLGSFVDALEPSDELVEDFRKAMSEAVVFKEHTDTFISIEITEYSGLSTYVQNPEEPYLDDYYRTLDWNIATGMVAE